MYVYKSELKRERVRNCVKNCTWKASSDYMGFVKTKKCEMYCVELKLRGDKVRKNYKVKAKFYSFVQNEED